MWSRKNTVNQVLAAASNRPLSDEELSARWGKDHKNRQSHIDYVIEVCGEVLKRAPKLSGYKIVKEPPALRHFTSEFAPL